MFERPRHALRSHVRRRARGPRRHPRLRGLALAIVAGFPAAAAPPGLLAQHGGVSLPLGTAAPSATVEDLEGHPVELSELVAGRPAILEFWATWCPLCEALQPQLDRIRAEHGEDVAIVAVGVAINQNPRRIRRHLERHDPGYPHVYDARGEAVRAYQAVTTSIVVMLDAEGKVAYTGVGADQDLVGALNRLLGETGPRESPDANPLAPGLLPWSLP